MGYPQDLRNSIVKRLLSQEINYEEAAQEYGVSKQSMYHWVSEARKKARTVSRRTTNHNEMSTNIPLPNGISFTKMYHAYVLCQHFGLDSTQAGQICRREGLMMEDIKTFAKAVRNLDLTDPKEVESLISTSKQNRSKIKALESENRKAQTEIAKKDKVTAELSALLVLSKKAEAIWGGQGKLVSDQDRRLALKLIKDAVKTGARLSKACRELGITDRTYRNWIKREKDENGLKDGRLDRSNFQSPKAFSESETQRLIDRLSQPDVVDKSLPQAYITLLDNGEYYGSLSTIYRVMKKQGMTTRRNTVRPSKKRHKPSTFEATGPNQVWSWDITYMRDATCPGSFYYGYVVIDIYSRLIVHAEVYPADNAHYATEFLSKAFHKHGIKPRSLVLHSDNGSSMKAAETLALLDEWEVRFSHSRPRVSNDNPYSEAFFKTLKYKGGRYPRQGFRSLEKARDWVNKFVTCYNNDHFHSGIGYVTPQSRFNNEDAEILGRRKRVLEKARKKNPERWINGVVMNCEPAGTQFLNPEQPSKAVE